MALDQLTRPSATSAAVVSLMSLLGGGGGAWLASREKERPGETDEERQTRITRNALMGAALSGGGTAATLGGAGLLANSLSPDGTGPFSDFARKWLGNPVASGLGLAGAGTVIGGARGLDRGTVWRPHQQPTDAQKNIRSMHARRYALRGGGIGAAAGLVLPHGLDWLLSSPDQDRTGNVGLKSLPLVAGGTMSGVLRSTPHQYRWIPAALGALTSTGLLKDDVANWWEGR